MEKIFLIIRREYFTRVNNKAFLLLSLLVPVMLTGMFLSPLSGKQSAREPARNRVGTTLHVFDDGHVLPASLPPIGNVAFVAGTVSLENARKNLVNRRIDGVVHLPAAAGPQRVVLYTRDEPAPGLVNAVTRNLLPELQRHRLRGLAVAPGVLAQLQPDLRVETVRVGQTGGGKSNVSFTVLLSIMSALVIYFFIFFYGVRTLHAVAEEKANRISEIIISSVKPFQLMMGKILGITLAVFTQILLVIGVTCLLSYLGLHWLDSGSGGAAAVGPAGAHPEVSNALRGIDAVKFTVAFGVYFTGGFLLYAAIFAAIGAALDADADTLQFIFPVVLPLVFSLLLLTAAFNDPNTPAVWWASFIPFTSPVVMMMRVSFGVPWWQLVVSMSILVGTFLLVTLLAGRIYRVGILLYGTTPSLRTVGRWLVSSQ